MSSLIAFIFEGFNMTKEERAEYGRKYREANKEILEKKRKQYCEANKEILGKKRKQYCEANKEKIAERKRKYYEANKEKFAEYNKQYREANKEKTADLNRQWIINNRAKRNIYKKEYKKQKLHNDPLFKLTTNLRSLISGSFKRKGYKKGSKTEQILGCSFLDFKEYIEEQFTQGMNWANYGQWHIDHIIPISVAENEAQILILNRYQNLRPLWADENLSKSDSVPWELIL